jgi:hypothetical protein
MAILAGLLGFIGRFAGKVLTTTLGAESDGLPNWLPNAIAVGGLIPTAADAVLGLAERRRRR